MSTTLPAPAAKASAKSKPAPYVSPWDNEELRMFRKQVRRFVAEEFVPNEARWREQHRVDADAWTKAGATGILLTDIPEEYGGGGGTFAHETVVMEELAKGGVHFGSGVHSIVAHYLLFTHVLKRSNPLGRKVMEEFRFHGGPRLRVQTKDLDERGVDWAKGRVTGVRDGLPLVDDGAGEPRTVRRVDREDFVIGFGFAA